MAQVRVGDKLYNPDQMFEVEIDGVVGPVQLNATQMANYYDKSYKTIGGTQSAGELSGFTAPKPAAEKKEAPAPAAAPSAPRQSVLSPATPPPAPLDQKVTQQERDEVTKPAKGLENTIKTSPTLLREKRRKSYLTAGG